jgi:hypothetical protein
VKRKPGRTVKEVEEIADKLFERIGIPEATPESLRAWIEERNRLEAECRRKIIHHPGAADAIEQLQRQHLPGGELLCYFARLALEVHLYYRSSEVGTHVPGAKTLPSAQEARRAALFSKKVRTLAQEMRKFQSMSLSPEIVLGLSSRKTDDERRTFTEVMSGLPKTLDDYADLLVVMSRLFKPKRGRRGHPSLDVLIRNLVRGVLKTLDEALVSQYGVLKSLAVLTGAAYHVAGVPKRISPKTLTRLLDDIQT